MKPELGVCYYPEHWPEEMWASDARRMVETGITWVRIGEFAWSRLEPEPGRFEFDWLDRALDCLADVGLKIVLGTPTATPPRWMLSRHPDMLALDDQGNPRGFGSRRHYCFSHQGYKDASVRVVEILGDRYGRDSRIHAWQIDNEYGCHDTTLSYSPAAEEAFQRWLAQTYGNIDKLNLAWGNVFWSMEYTSFRDIGLPNLTVTQSNPAHELAFRRFSSDQVVAYNRAQATALRARSDAPLIHNYMGRVLEFDHFDVAADLDIASWDSYPIGFLSDRLEEDESHKSAYLRQGDPDMQAFHHDLYRAVGDGRWWVMEQQPGPVNWAPYNPAPLPGMVRLWSLEAFAHGAEVVSYFRWRQAPFAQEQMHAGLLRPDDVAAQGLTEANQTAQDLSALGDIPTARAPVAIVFDYPSAWTWMTLPQGADFDYFRLVLSAYRACRRAGLSVDIVPSTTRDFEGYGLILAPGLAGTDQDLSRALVGAKGLTIIGPRSFGTTSELSLAARRPDIDGLNVTITAEESFPPDHGRPVRGGGTIRHWLDRIETRDKILLATDDKDPVLVGTGSTCYLAGWPDAALWDRIITLGTEVSGIDRKTMPDGLRRRMAGDMEFAFNYGSAPADWNGETLPAAGVGVWRNGVRLL